MRRPIRVCVACLLFASTMAFSACAETQGSSADDAGFEALDHIDAMLLELDEADRCLELDVDFTTAEASATVCTAIDEATAHTDSAREELDAAKPLMEQAATGDWDGDWTALANELDGLMESHDEWHSSSCSFLKQLVITGICEVEIPLTESDLAFAFAGAATGEPDAVRTANEFAQTAFSGMSGMLMEAHELEPEAGLDAMAAFCDAEIEVVGMLEDVAVAMEKGDERKAQELLAAAQERHETNQDLPQPAIFDDTYSERWDDMHQHKTEHLDRVNALLGELG